MIPKIYQKNKFHYLGLLTYSIGFPTCLFLTEFFSFKIIAIPEIILLCSFILLIFSIIKDNNKLPSIIIALFILIYFPSSIIRFFETLSYPSRNAGVLNLFS